MFKFLEKLFGFDKDSHNLRYRNMNHGTVPLISSTDIVIHPPPQDLSSESSNNIEEKIVKLREIFGYQLADSVIMDLLSKYKTVDNTVNAFFDNNTYTPPIS
jgi:hypothetical protein